MRVLKLRRMPSPETSRVNLGRARNPWTEHSPEESALIWRLTLQWWLGARGEGRNPGRRGRDVAVVAGRTRRAAQPEHAAGMGKAGWCEPALRRQDRAPTQARLARH